MRRGCKCHGVSGSCTIQTCWMHLSDFREVGNHLKTKYERARKLELDKKPTRSGNSADSRRATALAFRGIAQTELVYLEDSPNYCVKNQSLGVHGTEGRECLRGGRRNATQWEKRSCHRLCHQCGLRVEKRRAEVVTSCNCKFIWCCTVKCDKCTQVVTKYYCARKEGWNQRQNQSRRKQLVRQD